MKISDFIAILEKIKKEHGDNRLYFNVRDYYSRYGESASNDFRPPTDSMWYSGFFSNGDVTTMTLHLDDNHDGKKPKITFRKS